MRHQTCSLLVVAASFAAAFAMSDCRAQPMPEQPDMTIDAGTRADVIRGALEAIQEGYVFPDVAAKTAEFVRQREAAGQYATLDSAKAFARQLTDDLQSVTRDKHLRVMYRSLELQRRQGALGGAPMLPNGIATPRALNYGFEKAERLEGNVGLVEIRSFSAEGPEMEQAASAAMTFVANTDALIIDLRRNGGGRPEMVALVTSYLFDGRTHLNDLYWRKGDRTESFFTRDEVAGKRFGGKKPVYVLVGPRTFSGAEEFAYNLKALGRATIVGETTGGGANPGGMRPLGPSFAVFVPTGRAINPVTKTNWEGLGVEPDVKVPAGEALEKAVSLARERLAR